MEVYVHHWITESLKDRLHINISLDKDSKINQRNQSKNFDYKCLFYENVEPFLIIEIMLD